MKNSPEHIAIVKLGELVDKADNFLAWLDNPAAPPAMQLDAVSRGLREVRREILLLYLQLGGVDEWGHTP